MPLVMSQAGSPGEPVQSASMVQVHPAPTQSQPVELQDHVLPSTPQVESPQRMVSDSPARPVPVHSHAAEQIVPDVHAVSLQQSVAHSPATAASSPSGMQGTQVPLVVSQAAAPGEPVQSASVLQVQPGPSSVHPPELQDHVFPSTPQVELPQLTVTDSPAWPVPVHSQVPESLPAS